MVGKKILETLTYMNDKDPDKTKHGKDIIY